MADNPFQVVTPEDVPAGTYAEGFDRGMRGANALTDRAPVQDTAVGIVDTLQSIGSIPLAVLPDYELADAARNSQILDQFRSAAYLEERMNDSIDNSIVTQRDGEWAGLVEGAKNAVTGGNTITDVMAQSPYLMIGPAAKAMGFAARAGATGIVGRGLAAVGGSSEGAIANRVAALSGIIEGSSSYGQTYERVLRETGNVEEATRQARISGGTALLAGLALGKATPGFEVDPLGINSTRVATQFLGDAVLPTARAIGAEAFEEGGMAITNTVTDNILAGRDPMEGVGSAVGEAAAISSLFTGGMRSPGLVRDTSKAIGAGVMMGLKAVGGGFANRAVTPDAAAVDAALAEANAPVQPEAPASDGLSDADRAINTIQAALREVTDTQPTQVDEAPTPVDEAPPVSEEIPAVDPFTIQDTNVKAVLAADKLNTIAEAPVEDDEVTQQQAAAIETRNSLEKSGNLDEARVAVENTSDAAIEQAAQEAPQNPEAAGLIEAVKVTDITRAPDSVVPDSLKPVVDKLKAAVAAMKSRAGKTPRTPGMQTTADQMLSTGWNTTGKRNARKKGMQEHVQNVVNVLRTLRENQRNAPVDLPVATEAARFMKQIAGRAAAFEKAREILKILDKWGENKAKYPEYKKYVDQGFINVEGTETLDEDGKPSGRAYEIDLRNKTSRSIIDIVKEDFTDAMAFYDALKSTYPKLMEAAEARADKQKEVMDARRARRELMEDNKPKPAAEQKKKAEPAKKADKPATTTVTATDPVVARKVTRALAAKGLKPVLKGSTVTVEAKDAAAAEAELAVQEKTAADQKKEIKPAAKPKATTPPTDKVELSASSKKILLAGIKALNEKGIKSSARGLSIFVDRKDRETATTLLNELELADAPEDLRELAAKQTPPSPPTAPATPAPAAPESAAAPVVSPNTVVTDARAEELRNKFKGTKLNSGLDPELVAASLELAIYHIERGARTFAAYSKVMLDEVGDAIRPYLKSAYKAARFDNRLPEAVRNEMTPISEVNKADVSVAPSAPIQEDTTDELNAALDAQDAADRESLAESSFEDTGEQLSDLPNDDGSDVVAQEPTPSTPTENPLTKVTGWAKVAGKTLLDWFAVRNDVSYENWVQQLKAAGVYALYEGEAQNLFNHFYALGSDYDTENSDLTDIPIGVFQAGEGAFASRTDKDKPFGSVSIFMTEDGKIPEVVGRAFALAGSIVVLRNAAMYNTAFNEKGEPRRNAIPGVWAKDIADLAMKILGAKAIRKYSLSIEQGAPLALGLSTVEALVRSGNFETTEPGVYTHATVPMQVFQREEGEGEGFPSKVLIPNDAAHVAGIQNLEGIDRTAQIFETERVWEVSDTAPEDMSTVDKVIQYTKTALSTKLRQGLFNREKVAHGLNTQMNDLRSALGFENMSAVLMGWYDEIPAAKDGKIPSSVRQALRSMHTAYMNEFRAADKYVEVTGNGLKKLFYKYHLGINNRAKTAMGPQNNKFLRDLFSSAQETLDLNNPDHVKFLKMALAQAFGVKTDINDPDTVVAKWDNEVAAEWTAKALEIQDALATVDADGKEIDPFTRQGKILEALRRDKPWSPRQLSAILTLGKMLKTLESPAQSDGSIPFENFLPFEIDGKTNGSFNTELFFGLGIRQGANLEQGGLFLSKIGATYEKERERMQKEYKSDDFYGRINQGAEIGYAQNLLDAFAAMQKKNPKLSANWWFGTVVQSNLNLLAAAGLIEFDADPDKSFSIISKTGKTIQIPQLRQFKFKRDAGKIAAIPVQYGGSARGVKSQLWSEMVRLLNQKWIELNTQLAKTPPGPARDKLFNQIVAVEEHLEGSDSFNKMNKDGTFKGEPTQAEKVWHYGVRDLAKALHGAYRAEKPTVAHMTDALVKLTNVAYMVKAAQWRTRLEAIKRAKDENVALVEKYGEKTWLFEPSREDFDQTNDTTLDLSFSTLNGGRSISLNSTEYDPDGSAVSGFGTKFETRLDIPVPKRVGVRILALLTIGGGDAAMGTDFFQENWNATDVFDGIELLVSQIMKAGEALNQSVWRTGEFDLLKDFFRLNEGITQFLQASTPEEQAAVMEIWAKIRPKKKSVAIDIDGEVEESEQPTFEDFRQQFENAEADFQMAYKAQREGWDRLVADGPHTMLQMGGGGAFTTPVERAAELALELEEDLGREDIVDLSEVGTREKGLYPNQFKDPRATRFEDEEGLIDVIMDGIRWVGKNTWNSPNAKFDEKTMLSAGTRRLLNVLRMASRAGAGYDSDKSVHPSAIKMYLRAKADGVLQWESDYTMAQLEEAVVNNTVLRTDNSPSPDGKPVFRNVRMVGREAKWVGYNDTDMGLKTAFGVARAGTLGREGIIAALDKVQWKNPIHRAVWKRLRNILNADVRVTLTPDLETWNMWSDATGTSRRFGSVGGLSIKQRIAVVHASPTLVLHELLHSVFTTHFTNFFGNINSVPVNLRGPINDLVQLMPRFMKLSPVGNTAFLQRVMQNFELAGDSAAALDEMLAYVLSSEQLIEENSPGFVTRVINRLKQILSRVLGISLDTADSFYDEVLDVFRGLTDNVEPVIEAVDVDPRAAASSSLADLEQMTDQAYRALAQRIYQGHDTDMKTLKREWRPVLAMAKSAYHLTPDQENMFTRIYVLMRAGQRSADVEAFINTTLAKHPQKDLFVNAPDMVAAAMALVAVEPTFANQLNALWAGEPTKGRLASLIDQALDTGQADTSQQILNESLSTILMNKEAYNSFLGTSVGRLDRMGRKILEAFGEKVDDFNDALPANTPDAVDLVLRAIASLTNTEKAEMYGRELQTAVNTMTKQRWLQKLVSDLQGTQGDGKLFHRAHNAMMNAINRTRSQFDNALPREMAKLFPDNFAGWNTLFESFGRLGVHTLGNSAREMYLNDAERKRMITVLESRVNNWIDAKNLGYYLVHRDVRPGSAQELLRNARAIADNVNGTQEIASEELVAEVDQLVTLYAIDFLEASERAKVGQFYRAHPAAMTSLIGMLKSVKEAEEATYSNQYKYIYWKDTLPLSTDPRSSVIIANAVDGARMVQLGYIKGEQYKRSAGDPETLHYYVRNYSPPPVFTQGIIATVQQTGMGINYTTAASVSPLVGTMITDKRVISYIQRNRGMNSNLIPIYAFDGELIGYERMLDPKIVRKATKGDNTQLHVAIGKRLGRIAEENIAKMINEEAVKSMVAQWEQGKADNRADEYEAVDSSTDKQVARAWEVIPADMKETLQQAFNGPVMIRRELVEDTLGYHNMAALEIFTGDASIDPQTRKAIIGLVQTVFFGPKGMQVFLAAEQAVKEAVATAKDTIIVRSLSVPYNNALAAIHIVMSNGVPITKVFKWYRQGMKEVQAFNRLERERVQLTIQIAGVDNQAEKNRLQAVRASKIAAIQRLSIYPLIAAGDLSDLPEGLDDTPSHTYLGDLGSWVNDHLREKVHPKAPAYLANALFAKDSTLHDAMSKAIQAGDFLARYAIYQHNIERGVQQSEALDIVRDELVSYQTNPGRMRGGLEMYGMVWWSQFSIRAQNVILNRFRKNPFSFFVSQGFAGLAGTPGPMDGFITERGLDNSIGVDNVFTAPSAYLYTKAF